MASPENIMAELGSKVAYTESTLLLLCDVTSGIKKLLKELDKVTPGTKQVITPGCKNNITCLETYKQKQR